MGIPAYLMGSYHALVYVVSSSPRNVGIQYPALSNLAGFLCLTGRLMPDFKTIADFRKDNGKAMQTHLEQAPDSIRVRRQTVEHQAWIKVLADHSECSPAPGRRQGPVRVP